MTNSTRTAMQVSLAALTIGMAAPIAAQAEDITLQWFSTALSEAQYEPVWKQIVADFEAANAGVKIEPIFVPRADSWTKFVTAAQARIAPCVVNVPLPTAAYNGYLMPLDKFWDAEPDSYKSVWSQESLGVARFDGQLYGLPYYGGIYGEVYNTNLLEEAGLDPDDLPDTWEEYLDWAKKLHTDDHDALAVLAGPTDTTTRVLLSWIYSNGGKPFNDDLTESYFSTDPATVEAIKFYVALETEHGVTSPGSAALNYAEQTVLFAQGKIATMRNAYWGLAKVLGDSPELEGKIVVAAPPVNVPGGKTVASVGTNSVSANCEHPQEAWDFIKFMVEPKYSVQMVKTSNWMPLRNDLLDVPEVKDNPIVSAYLAMGANAVTVPLPTPAWTQIASKDIVNALQRILQDPDKIDEILAELDETVTEHLNDI